MHHTPQSGDAREQRLPQFLERGEQPLLHRASDPSRLQKGLFEKKNRLDLLVVTMW